MHHLRNTALARVCQTLRWEISYSSQQAVQHQASTTLVYMPAAARLYTQVHTEQAYATAKSASFQIADVRFAQ